jgi:hypothetical protein
MLLKDFLNYKQICPACNKKQLKLSLSGRREIFPTTYENNYEFKFILDVFDYNNQIIISVLSINLENNILLVSYDKKSKEKCSNNSFKNYWENSQKCSNPYAFVIKCPCNMYYYRSNPIELDINDKFKSLTIIKETFELRTNLKRINFINYYDSNKSRIYSIACPKDNVKQLSLPMYIDYDQMLDNTCFDFNSPFIKDKLNTYLTFI